MQSKGRGGNERAPGLSFLSFDSSEWSQCSEEDEDLLDVTLDVLDLLADDVEAHGLGEGAALADSDHVTDLDAEGGRAVHGDVLMALLESVVLLDVVQVIAADDDRAGHFVGDDHTPDCQQRTRTMVSQI